MSVHIPGISVAELLMLKKAGLLDEFESDGKGGLVSKPEPKAVKGEEPAPPVAP